MALTDNLVSYWKLDEASGNASDSVGGNTLTNTNTATYSAGKINNGANFVAASSQKLAKTSVSNLPSSRDARTISLWFKTGDVTTMGTFFSYGTYTTSQALQIGVSSTDGKVFVDVGAQSLDINYTFSNNTWYNVVVTLPGASQVYTTYVNGASVGTLTFSGTINTVNSLMILGTNLGSDNYFTGSVDEVGIWSRALSYVEVSQLYNASRGLAYPLVVDLTTSLVSYWKMDEASGNATDSVGSNTAVNTNTTYSTGKINNGAVFNGTSAKLLPTDITIFNGDFSVSMWVSRNAAQDGYIFGRTTSTSPYGTFNIYYGNGDSLLHPGLYNTAASFQGPATTTTLTQNTWYHFVFTVSGTTMKAYVNGSQQGGDVTFTGTRGNVGTTCFGQRNDDGAVKYSGGLDEVGVWNRALSSTEVTSLYNGGSGFQYPFSTTKTYLGFF